MRTLLQVSMDVNAANRAIRDGQMQKTVDSMMTLLKPEAAYFTTVRGKRTALIIFDLKDPSMIPQIAEPFFDTLAAEVDFQPVMNREELIKGLKSIQGGQKAA